MEKSSDPLHDAILAGLQGPTPNVKCAASVNDIQDDCKHSSTVEGKVKDLVQRGFHFYRRVRGDGNCYYRSVGYAYLEWLISRGPEAVEDLIKKLREPDMYTSLKREDDKGENLISGLGEIRKELAAGGKEPALKKLLCMALTKPDFDHAVTRFVRRMVFNFILNNDDFVISGLSIANIEAVERMSLSKYLMNVVLLDGEDARLLVISIAPLVLRINIGTVLLDMQDKRVRGVTEQVYPARAKGFDYKEDDRLNFHDDTIYLLLKPGHYDILYKRDYFEKSLGQYDQDYATELAVSQKDDPAPASKSYLVGNAGRISSESSSQTQQKTSYQPFASERSSKEVQKKKKTSEESKSQCTVCHRLISQDQTRFDLSCGHQFHLGCIWDASGRSTEQMQTFCVEEACQHELLGEELGLLQTMFDNLKNDLFKYVKCEICHNPIEEWEPRASHCDNKYMHLACIRKQIDENWRFRCVTCGTEFSPIFLEEVEPEKVPLEQMPKEKFLKTKRRRGLADVKHNRFTLAKCFNGKNIFDDKGFLSTIHGFPDVIFNNDLIVKTHCASCGASAVNPESIDPAKCRQPNHKQCFTCRSNGEECGLCGDRKKRNCLIF
ncbi:MAG: hypothetical protein P4M11_14685 [Candidatus Pacebacteria bacterium]|nr:hypothetical protein [Candidatus Paceibacterota bacterium]